MQRPVDRFILNSYHSVPVPQRSDSVGRMVVDGDWFKVGLLLKGGINPNEINLFARSKAFIELISRLDRGSDKDKENRMKTIEIMLEHGADPNMKNYEHTNTGLFDLISNRRVSIANTEKGQELFSRLFRLLMSYGLDINIKCFGRSYMFEAMNQLPFTHMFDTLFNAGADPHNIESHYLYRQLDNKYKTPSLEVLMRRKLLSAGADISMLPSVPSVPY